MLDAIAHSGGRYRGVAIVDESFIERTTRFARRRHPRRAVQFRQAPGRHARHEGIRRDSIGLDRSAGISSSTWTRSTSSSCRACFVRCRCRSSSITWDASRRRSGVDQPPFRALLDLLQVENCWVKVCGSERVSATGPPFLDAVPFARALATLRRTVCCGEPIGRIQTSAVMSERWRSRGSGAADRAERSTQTQAAGRQSGAPLRFRRLIGGTTCRRWIGRAHTFRSARESHVLENDSFDYVGNWINQRF